MKFRFKKRDDETFNIIKKINDEIKNLKIVFASKPKKNQEDYEALHDSLHPLYLKIVNILQAKNKSLGNNDINLVDPEELYQLGKALYNFQCSYHFNPTMPNNISEMKHKFNLQISCFNKAIEMSGNLPEAKQFRYKCYNAEFKSRVYKINVLDYYDINELNKYDKVLIAESYNYLYKSAENQLSHAENLTEKLKSLNNLSYLVILQFNCPIELFTSSDLKNNLNIVIKHYSSLAENLLTSKIQLPNQQNEFTQSIHLLDTFFFNYRKLIMLMREVSDEKDLMQEQLFMTNFSGIIGLINNSPLNNNSPQQQNMMELYNICRTETESLAANKIAKNNDSHPPHNESQTSKKSRVEIDNDSSKPNLSGSASGSELEQSTNSTIVILKKELYTTSLEEERKRKGSSSERRM